MNRGDGIVRTRSKQTVEDAIGALVPYVFLHIRVVVTVVVVGHGVVLDYEVERDSRTSIAGCAAAAAAAAMFAFREDQKPRSNASIVFKNPLKRTSEILESKNTV